MAKFVYLDETGSVGKGAANQPELRLVAAIVDESQVMPLGQSMKQVARDHLGGRPPGFEFHGQELWHGQGCWEGKSYPELLAVYLDVMTLLEDHEVDVAYSAIDKKKLSAKYDGMADENAYLLALQFLLEKIDQNMGESLKIVVADEARQEQLKAMSMVTVTALKPVLRPGTQLVTLYGIVSQLITEDMVLIITEPRTLLLITTLQ